MAPSEGLGWLVIAATAISIAWWIRGERAARG